MAEDGSFFVAWVERSELASARYMGLCLQPFDARGDAIGPVLNVDPSAFVGFPSLAIGPQRQVAIAYTSRGRDQSEIFFRGRRPGGRLV